MSLLDLIKLPTPFSHLKDVLNENVSFVLSNYINFLLWIRI